MTSVISAHPSTPDGAPLRRRTRSAATAAGLTGALVLALAACGSGGDDNGDGSSSTPSATSTANTGGGTGSSGSTDGTDGTASSSGLPGSWLATTDGKAVALVVTGKKAALFTTGGSVCSGAASGSSISLTCVDGNKDRAKGTVDSVNSTTLKVTWQGNLGSETYTRAEGGRLPSGLPTSTSTSTS